MLNSIMNQVSRRQLMLVALGAGMVLGLGHSVQAQQAQQAPMADKQIGLRGYCPVCVIDARKWAKGSPDIVSTYDGITYQFPSKEVMAKFDANPAKYVPALGGDCIVCYAKMGGKRVPGSVSHVAIYKDRLYLFPGAGEKQAFKDNPEAFVNADLAANGECIVCLAKMNKHVPGKAKFTEIHNGLRYLFPSANEAAEFRRSPDQYAAVVKGDMRVGKTDRPPERQVVTVSGMSACAGCEFGVTPLSNPDELGLAVKTSEGNIVVVERAHKLYPKIYEARFEGQNLKVMGKILKTDGRIAWLSPSSVQVVN